MGYDAAVARRRAGRRARCRRDATTCAAASTTVGPHRDELELAHRRPAGPHPRLAGRAAVAGPGPAARPRTRWSTERTGSRPVLAARRRVLRAGRRRAATPCWRTLPAGQTMLTTAGALPPGADPELGRCASATARSCERRDAPAAMRGEPQDERTSRAAAVTASLDGAVSARSGLARPGAGGGTRSAPCSGLGRRRRRRGGRTTSRAGGARRPSLVVEVDDPAWATQLRCCATGAPAVRLTGASSSRRRPRRRPRPVSVETRSSARWSAPRLVRAGRAPGCPPRDGRVRVVRRRSSGGPRRWSAPAEDCSACW